MASHITPPSPTTTSALLLAAADHNLPALTSLLKKIPSINSCLDETTSRSALHIAIDSLPSSPSPDQIIAAGETLQLLLNHGAIWNDLDSNNETPGCIAFRRGFTPLYDIMVAAGVRAEILMSRIGGWGEIESDSEDEVEEEEAPELVIETADGEPKLVTETASGEPTTAADAQPIATNPKPEAPALDHEVKSGEYLTNPLVASDTAILDANGNGVMMAWETNIMKRSVDELNIGPESRVLNVGFGMGIIDGIIQERLSGTGQHTIVEAHPDVIGSMRAAGWDKKPNVTILEGKWQDVVPDLIADGAEFDAIYFDTFAEGYADLKMFFSEVVLSLLEQEKGKFGFFHGLGADRRVCWDVYTKVLEMDLWEAGLEVRWVEVESEVGKEEWEGVKRKYWDVGSVYRLPVCEFVTM